MDCLYCRGNIIALKYQEETPNFRLLTMFCVTCNRTWKDYEVLNDAAESSVPIQEQKNLPEGGQTNN